VPEFEVVVAATLECWGKVSVKAETAEAAEAIVKKDIADNGWESAAWEEEMQIEWETARDLRVMDGETVDVDKKFHPNIKQVGSLHGYPTLFDKQKGEPNAVQGD